MTKAAPFLVLIALFLSLWLTLRFNFLLFHCLAEQFGIAVGVGIFLIAWNTRRLAGSSSLIPLGTAFFFIAILELMHVLTHKGMNIVPDMEADLATYLWTGSRYMLGLSLLAFPSIHAAKARLRIIFPVYAVITALFVLSAFIGIFPPMYIEGIEPTRFKTASEYVICIIFLAAAWNLHRRRENISPLVRLPLITAIFLSIVAQLAFYIYGGEEGISDVFGHIFKIASYYFIYKALVETTLVRPYEVLFRELKQKEAELKHNQEDLERRVVERTEELYRANRELVSEVKLRASAEEELRVLANKLRRSNQDLEEFAYVASHDLQEPLRRILTFGDRLQEEAGGRLDQESLDTLSRMQKAARRMQDLIKSLLSYARSTTAPEPFGPVDLGQILKEVCNDLTARIEETGGRIEEVPLPVIEGNALQVRQIFTNLISNGLKYRKPGQAPVIKVYSNPQDCREGDASAKQNGKCTIMVEDNGIGFNERHLDRIFQPLQRLHGDNAYEGTGIGLAIVRKLVESHGWTITAKSRPGLGSTFIIELPEQSDARSPHPRNQGRMSASAGAGEQGSGSPGRPLA